MQINWSRSEGNIFMLVLLLIKEAGEGGCAEAQVYHKHARPWGETWFYGS